MISTLTGNSNSKIIHKWSLKSPYVSNDAVEADKVYAVASGYIVYIGKDSSHYVINIRTNSNEILRYGHLKSLNISQYTDVDSGALLGKADKYVTFEYCTTWKIDSLFPVYISDVQYFKQDPTDILNGTYLPASTQIVGRSTDGNYDIEFDEYQATFFGEVE